MAGRIGKPCRAPRCPAIVDDHERYCAKHLEEYAPKWKSKDNSDELRKFYNTQGWKNLRLYKLTRDPICEVCRIAPATQVHHLARARLFPELRLDMNNLQSICGPCHAAESQNEGHQARIAKKIHTEK